MKILHPATRQYRHNNNNDFVFGYDRKETEKIVGKLVCTVYTNEQEIEQLEEEVIGLNNIIKAAKRVLDRSK